ncbi:MAG: helix-turn-helix transcriptional regulator [Gemmatimonadales bacterium]
MPAKTQRWVDLIAALLRRHYAASFEELARDVPGYQDPDQQFEARRRMFERDKDELRKFGVPIQTTDNAEGEIGYQLRRRDFYLPYIAVLEEGRENPLAPRVAGDGYRGLPTLAFEPDELRAIYDVGPRLLSLRIASLLDDARSALRKLGASPVPPPPPEQASAAELSAAFDTLNDALARRKLVTFSYHSLSSSSHTSRTAQPYGLVALGHQWYLVAVEVGDTIIKQFRLNRMSDVSANPKAPGTHDYEIPPDFNLREHARLRPAWDLGSADAIDALVEVRKRNGTTRVVERLGDAVEGHPDQRMFRVRRHDTFVRWLLGQAGGAVPIEPPELVARYREMARETLARYEGKGA